MLLSAPLLSVWTCVFTVGVSGLNSQFTCRTTFRQRDFHRTEEHLTMTRYKIQGNSLFHQSFFFSYYKFQNSDYEQQYKKIDCFSACQPYITSIALKKKTYITSIIFNVCTWSVCENTSASVIFFANVKVQVLIFFEIVLLINYDRRKSPYIYLYSSILMSHDF